MSLKEVLAAVLFGSAAPTRFCQHTAVSSGESFFSRLQASTATLMKLSSTNLVKSF